MDTSESITSRASSRRPSNGIRLNADADKQIFGRSPELDLLQEAFQRVIAVKEAASGEDAPGDSSAEIALVHGESGYGKSSLVRAFRGYVVKEKQGDAFFLEGKFDQNTDSSQPYSAIVDAVTQLCYSIKTSGYLAEIQKSTEKSLSAEIGDLYNLIPAMEVITSELPVLDEQVTARTTGNYAFKLFMDTFRSFLKLVCEVHPVVLFLDDLQWADEASRQLISTITSDSSVKRFFFIGAYRDGDDEKDANSNFSWIGYPSKANSTRVLNILLGPLDETSVNEMVASMMEAKPMETKELSKLVGRKTGRNAYFVSQYMEDLQRQGLLRFSLQSNKWEWDLEQIKGRTDVSDNVVALLSKKINSMPDDVQTVLRMASCLGFVVDINSLEQIVLAEGLLLSDKMPPQEETHDPSEAPAQEDSENCADENETNSKKVEERKRYHVAYKQAMKEGLIENTASGKFKFSHDRVQQAAYSLMPPGKEGVQLHIRVGEILLKMSTTTDGEEWMFFSGVDILSKFASHFLDTKPRIELARLSLEAGKIAESKSAFIPATKYLETGISMLDEADRWSEHYELCLELHVKAAEVGRTYGAVQSTLALVEETLNNARSFEDKLKVLHVKMYVLAGQNRLSEAYKASIEVLRELDVKLPSNPKTISLIVEYMKTKRQLKGRKPQDMLSLPRISDEMAIETMHFLNAAAIFAWHADRETVASFVFLRMMRLTLKHGICKFSPFALATFGMLLAALGDRTEGYAFGRVALELSTQLEGSKECLAATTLVVESCLTHLKKPLYESLSPLIEAHKTGMQTGEIEFAALCLSAHGGMIIVVGANLDNVKEALLNYGKLIPCETSPAPSCIIHSNSLYSSIFSRIQSRYVRGPFGSLASVHYESARQSGESACADRR